MNSVYKLVISLPLVVFVLGLSFRATLYWSIPVAPGEPKGGGEIIELLFFLLLMGFCALSILLGLLLALIPRLRNKAQILKLVLVGSLLPIFYFFVHPLVPKLV